MATAGRQKKNKENILFRMSGVKRRYQGVPILQLAIEGNQANSLPKVSIYYI
jgi:hypothetical protein